ncbi:hypothetical protein M2347_003065 [Chryseobacterium sp. H1D6B]|uniref:hypothetical protein n=1 Tax=Chryseobacterium sp. H1D6B TaxID=2940588 RepID=UPI0015C779C4|nr:hypothetical protein [Chryseobacterium sp. H1D6B]MDH6253338.1 hypothetical protein [Chryseobacterium sp. H1D6B]
MSIKIKVAFCKECNGYYSSTPAEKNNNNHPDIIDHFLYHGEPWVTLDHQAFEQYKNYENLEVRTVSLQQHMKKDHLYCTCKKKIQIKKAVYMYELKKTENNNDPIEKYEVDTDIYFRDLYYTYNTFHGIGANHKHNSTRLRTYSS